jgi:hypothetical protein
VALAESSSQASEESTGTLRVAGEAANIHDMDSETTLVSRQLSRTSAGLWCTCYAVPYQFFKRGKLDRM